MCLHLCVKVRKWSVMRRVPRTFLGLICNTPHKLIYYILGFVCVLLLLFNCLFDQFINKSVTKRREGKQVFRQRRRRKKKRKERKKEKDLFYFLNWERERERGREHSQTHYVQAIDCCVQDRYELRKGFRTIPPDHAFGLIFEFAIFVRVVLRQFPFCFGPVLSWDSSRSVSAPCSPETVSVLFRLRVVLRQFPCSSEAVPVQIRPQVVLRQFPFKFGRA